MAETLRVKPRTLSTDSRRTCPTSLLLKATLLYISTIALSVSSVTPDTPRDQTCYLPPNAFGSTRLANGALVSEAVKTVLRLPVSIVNGSHFNLAAHLFTPQQLEEGQEGGEALTELCSHRQEIALVLLHGATYNAQYWDADTIDGHSHSFARYFARLCYTVIALDELGVGESDRPNGFSLNIADHVRSTHQVMESLRQKDNSFRRRPYRHVVLIGHSFGATLAMTLLATFPDDADLLINTAASLGHEPTLPELGFMLASNPGPYLSLPTEGPRGNLRQIFLYNESLAAGMIEYDRTKLADDMARATFIELGQQFAYRRSPESADAEKVIRKYQSDRLKIPIMHQCGDRDVFAKAESCLQGPAFFPNAPEVITDLLTDMGHSFNLHTNNLVGWGNIARYIGEKYPLERCLI